MDRNEVEEKARKIVTEHLGVDADKVVEKAVWEDLGADSLDLVELVMGFEEEFNIEVPDDVADKWTTFGEAVDGIAELKRG